MATLRVCRQLAVIFLLGCLAFAQSVKPQDYAKSADSKAKAGDYPGAIEDYDKALAGETNARRRQSHEEELQKVKKLYYRQLVEEAAQRSSTQAKIDLLTKARELEIEHTGGKLGGVWGIGGKNFSEVAEEGKKARKQIIGQLADEIQKEAGQQNYDVALSIYDQAYRLDPQESQALAEVKDQIHQQMERGRRLADEAWQRLEDKQHGRAKELFNQAESAFPAQDRIQEGRRQIQQDEADYYNLKSRAQQLDRADQAGGLDAYRAALEVHPELGRADKLGELRQSLQLRLKKAEAWKRLESQDYLRSQQLFEELADLDPSDEKVRSGLDKANSMLSLLEGKRAVQDGLYPKARKFFQEALELDSANDEARQLLDEDDQYLNQVAEGRRLFQRSQKEGTPQDCQQSIIHFQEARKLNEERFGKEELDPLVAEGDCQAVIPLPFELLTAGLDSYLEGKPSDAIESLEAALGEVGEGRAAIHALLGAAYCFSGLFQGTQDSANLEKGREQFRLALKADPEYRLSESLFSPQIRRIFEEVRAELQAAENEPSQQAPNRPDNR